MRHWNLPLFRSLDAAELAKTFKHPEDGEMTLSMLLARLAGHELHHLEQLRTFASQAQS